MTIELTQKVHYSANERIDLNDKSAEDSLLDKTLQEYSKGILEDDQDGRIMFGWRASTPVIYPTFTIAAEPGFAIARDGTYCLRDGSVASSLSLTSNAINYFHAYFDEADTDIDNRRSWIAGTEVTQSLPTRITRTAGVYQSTKPYASGTPPFSGFDSNANIGGKIRQLVPLYAVVVNNASIVEGTYDYRPLFAMGINGQGSNLYDSVVLPDIPHTFSPSDSATLGITSLRRGLVALADRLKSIKNTTTWYADNFDQVILNSSGHIRKSVNNSFLVVAGGSSATNGGRISFTGGSYTTPDTIRYYAVDHVWYSQDGSSKRAVFATTRRAGVGDLTSGFLPTAKLHTVSESDDNATFYGASNSTAAVVTATFQRARGTATSPASVAESDVLGGLTFQGNYGGSLYSGAAVFAVVDATPGVSDMPTRLAFYTSPDGSSTPTERMRISRDGQINIGTAADPYALLTLTSSTQYEGLSVFNGTNEIAKVFGSLSGNDAGNVTLACLGRVRVWLSGDQDRQFPVTIYGDSTTPNRRTSFLAVRSRSDNVVHSGDYLGVFATGGKYAASADNENFSSGSNGGTEIVGKATQAWDSDSRGAGLLFKTTANDAAASSDRLWIDNDGAVRVYEYAAIGRDPSNHYGLWIDKTLAPGSITAGLRLNTTHDTADPTYSKYGLLAYNTVTNTSGTMLDAHGAYILGEVAPASSGGTVTDLRGLSARTNLSVGTVTRMIGARVLRYQSSGNFDGSGYSAGLFVGDHNYTTGTKPPNCYGLYVDQQTGGISNYSIYTRSGLVRFGDHVVLDESTNTVRWNNPGTTDQTFANHIRGDGYTKKIRGHDGTNVVAYPGVVKSVTNITIPSGSWGSQYVTLPASTLRAGSHIKVVAGFRNSATVGAGAYRLRLHYGSYDVYLLDGDTRYISLNESCYVRIEADLVVESNPGASVHVGWTSQDLFWQSTPGCVFHTRCDSASIDTTVAVTIYVDIVNSYEDMLLEVFNVQVC